MYLKLKGQGKSVTFHQAATRACSYLTAICNDKRLGAYTRADANSFRDYLIRKGLSGKCRAPRIWAFSVGKNYESQFTDINR